MRGWNVMAKAVLQIIGGQNLLTKKQKTVVIMKSVKKEPGIVTVDKRRFYYLGLNKNQSHERSAGKAAAGAIAGGLLTGGVGAVAGAAIGGRKKDTSTAILDFMDYETEQQFSVQIKMDKKTQADLSYFKVHPGIE